ncbi:MAG: hypothetical protein NC421_03690 [Lachnospiraceae bacterium]|nr:hypothetical protein [Lachnospiraceae bacterium]
MGIKHLASAILLTFVVLTSVLRFHHHDCHGHMSFAFSENNECPTSHIHLCAVGDENEPHDQQHFCHIIIEFQASEPEFDFGTLLQMTTAILPEWAPIEPVHYKIADIFTGFSLRLPLDLFRFSFNLRAPPIDSFII